MSIGLIVAITIAFILHKRGKNKDEDTLLIELSEYKTPNARTVAIYVWDKVKDYLTKAGTTIFCGIHCALVCLKLWHSWL
ncbi:MAG: hypothetical protein ACLUD2_16120 [Clostridium sp.]